MAPFLGGINLENIKTSTQIPIDINGRCVHKIVYAIQPKTSCVYISHNGRTVNAKSILGVLSLNLKKKDIVDIFCYNENIDVAEQDCKAVEKILTKINEYD